MDTGLRFTLELLIGFILTFGLMYFLWMGLDIRDARKHGQRRFRSNHLHHVLLGVWPFLITLLVLLSYGKAPMYVTAAIFLLTGLLYYCLGLWDVRQTLFRFAAQQPGEKIPQIQISFAYPGFAIVFGSMGIGEGFSAVVSLIFNLYSENMSYLSALLFLGVSVAMFPLAAKIMGMWEKQVRLASQQRS
jgi:hypothetical protein